MSRYATAIDLHAWKSRHHRRGKKGRKPRRKGYAPAGMVAGEDRPRRRERDDDDDEETDDDLGGWEGDLEADLDADLADPPDLGDDDLGEGELGDDDLGDEEEAGDDDVGALRLFRRRDRATPAAPTPRTGPLARLRGPAWATPVNLGANLQIRARRGFRAAVVEVKPGLFVVAEVPQSAVEFGFGPLLLGPALVKTLTRAFTRSQAGEGAGDGGQRPDLPVERAPRQLPGPTTDQTEGDDRVPRWVDGELAEELGCGACRRRERA
jgi:hypothetical protein